jgi:hypothetical protein
MIHFWPNGLIREAQMSATIAVQDDFEAQELRVFAGRVKDANQARRLLAIAAILDGMDREEAARIGGMDRQTLRYDGASSAGARSLQPRQSSV